MDIAQVYFSAEATITFNPDEIKILMDCATMNRVQNARWATAPGGFIYQAYQSLLRKESNNPQVRVTKHKLKTILDIIGNENHSDPCKNNQKENIKNTVENILTNLISQEQKVSEKNSISSSAMSAERRKTERRKANRSLSELVI